MGCSACGGSNEQGATFCGKCGVPLAKQCASCHHPLERGAIFCSQCGASVGPASQKASHSDAERRQLTVMFCDLVGSVSISERLDSEELRELIERYHESCGSVIQRFEGHVAQYLGDGMLVYFGYPMAREDDAVRAVRAGLEIIAALERLNRRIRNRLDVRVGINTGQVVVGEIGR